MEGGERRLGGGGCLSCCALIVLFTGGVALGLLATKSSGFNNGGAASHLVTSISDQGAGAVKVQRAKLRAVGAATDWSAHQLSLGEPAGSRTLPEAGSKEAVALGASSETEQKASGASLSAAAAAITKAGTTESAVLTAEAAAAVQEQGTGAVAEARTSEALAVESAAVADKERKEAVVAGEVTDQKSAENSEVEPPQPVRVGALVPSTVCQPPFQTCCRRCGDILGLCQDTDINYAWARSCVGGPGRVPGDSNAEWDGDEDTRETFCTDAIWQGFGDWEVAGADTCFETGTESPLSKPTPSPSAPVIAPTASPSNPYPAPTPHPTPE